MLLADRPSDDSVLAIEIRYVRSEPRDIVCPNQALLREMTDWTQGAMDCVRQVRRFDTGLATIFQARDQHLESQSILQLIDFILNDEPGVDLMGDKLWPQLWAMQQVEPLVSDLVEDIYERYIQTLEQALRAAGNDAPRAEALCLMSMLEGATIFMGRGRRWEPDLPEVRTALMHFFESRYGET